MVDRSKYLGDIFHNDNLSKNECKKKHRYNVLSILGISYLELRTALIQEKVKILEAVVLPTVPLMLKIRQI